jgi:hypothetical protein
MSKVFTDLPLYPFQQARAESFNNNLDKVIDEVNGNLNSNNMPINSISANQMLPGVGSETTVSGHKQLVWDGQFQKYRRNRKWNTFEGSLNFYEPVVSIDLTTSNWTSGWNKLSDFSFGYLPINMNCKEGMLSGCANIDFHHGIQVVRSSTSPSAPKLYGYGWHTEWAVFANDSLIAQTDKIYTNRTTINLPYKLGVGSGAITLDIRFKVITGRDTTVIEDPTTLLDIFGAGIWARNTFR